MIQLTQQQQDKQADRTCPECGEKSRPEGTFSQLYGWLYDCTVCKYRFWVGLLQVRV